MSNVQVPSYRQRVGYHAMLLGAMALITSALLVLGDTRTRDDIALRLKEDMQASLRQVIPANLHDNEPLDDSVNIHHHDTSVQVYRARMGSQIVAVAFEVSENGYAGPIKMIMGVDMQGKVVGTRVIAHAETPGLGDKIEISKDDWITRFDGKSLGEPVVAKWKVKKDGGVFDQFTGATITPRAVIKAIKNGLEFFAQHKHEIMATTNPIKTSQHRLHPLMSTDS